MRKAEIFRQTAETDIHLSLEPSLLVPLSLSMSYNIKLHLLPP